MGFFGEIIVLDAQNTTYVFIALLTFLLIFKAGLHIIEMYCQRNGFMELLENLYREFMMMGLISFGTFVSNEAYDYATSELYSAFHFAHMTILFIGLTFILQAILLINLVATRKRTLLRFSATSSHELLADYHTLMSSNNLKSVLFRNGPLSMSFPELREQIEIRILKDFFIRSFNLPEEFNFAVYTCSALKKYVISLSEVRPISWLILAFFFAINYGKVIIVDDRLKLLHCYVDGNQPIKIRSNVNRNIGDYSATSADPFSMSGIAIGRTGNEDNVRNSLISAGANLLSIATTVAATTTTSPAEIEIGGGRGIMSPLNFQNGNNIDSLPNSLYSYQTRQSQQVDEDSFYISRRSLSATASETELCREYMLSYAIFCAFMLTFFLTILLIFSEIYMRRLLEKVLLTEIDLEWEEEDQENEKEKEREFQNENNYELLLIQKEKEILKELENDLQYIEEEKNSGNVPYLKHIQPAHSNSTSRSGSYPAKNPTPFSLLLPSQCTGGTAHTQQQNNTNFPPHTNLSLSSSLHPIPSNSSTTIINDSTGNGNSNGNSNNHINNQINKPGSIIKNISPSGLTGDSMDKVQHIRAKVLSRVTSPTGNRPRSFTTNNPGTDVRTSEIIPIIPVPSVPVRSTFSSSNQSPRGSSSFMTPSMRRSRSQSFSVISQHNNTNPHHHLSYLSSESPRLPPSIIHEQQQQQEKARARSNTFIQYVADSLPVTLTSSSLTSSRFLYQKCLERICHNEEERHLRNSGHHEKDGNIDSRGMDNKDNGYDNYNDNNNSNNGEFITESGLYSPSNLSVKGFQRNPMYNNNNNNNNNNKNDKNKDNENENQNQSQSQSQNKIHDYHSKQNHMNKSISHIGPHAESDNSNVSQKSFLSQIFIKSNSEKEVEVEKKREKEKKKENGNDRNIDRNIDRENEKENEKEIEKSTMNINHNGDRGGERGEGGRGSKGGVERILGRTRSVTAENILSRASFQSHTQSSKSAAAHANSRNNSYVDPLNLNSVTSTSTFGSIQNNDRKDNDNNDNNNHTNYYDNNNNSSSNMNDSSNSNYSHSILSCHSLTAEDQLELGGVSVSISDSESEFSDSLLHSDSPKSPFYASRLWIGGHIADNNLNNNNKNNNYSNNNSNSNNNINNSNLSNNNNNNNTKNDTSNSPLIGISPIPKVNYITDPTHLATHSNSYPNFTGTGSPIAKNKKTEKLNNLMKIDLKHDSDNSSNNNSSSKKNNKNNAEKTENLLQPRGRIKRAYSDIFFQMAIPENINTVTANNSRANSMVGANNVDLLRIKKLAEIDRQKKKASEKKSMLEKMMSANIDIFDNSTTVRKNIEKNNEGNNYNNDHNGYSNNIKNNNNPTTVLPYFIMKQLKKLGTSFSNFAYYFYEILILGPHAGESDMQEGEKPKKLIFL